MQLALADTMPLSLRLRDLVVLTKPRITLMVVITALAGMWLAPVTVSPLKAWIMLLTTAGVVSSASVLNCWLERDVDRLMRRTASRPLPAGRMQPKVALVFGLLLGLVALPLQLIWVNGLTAALSAFSLFTYVVLYTPLKQRSPLALWMGAIPGAMPPLMGWTAATAQLDPPGLVLFALMFIWQVPHFMAISIFRKEEYARAGMRVPPLVWGERAAKFQGVLYAAALLPVSLWLVPMGVVGHAYLWVAGVLGAGFLALSAYGLIASSGPNWARSWFFTSLIYLTAIFVLLFVDARVPLRA